MKKNIKLFVAGFLSAFIILIAIDVYAVGIQKTIEVVLNKVNISQDGTLITMADEDYVLESGETVPFSIVYKNTTYLPVRKLAEIFGKEVKWDGENNLIGINSPGYIGDDEDVTTFIKANAALAAQPSPAPTPPPYDFSVPVPTSSAVEEAYFTNSAFLGNSLIQGFMGYSGIKVGDNLGLTSLSVFNAFSKADFKTEAGKKITVMEALALKEYERVYVLFGINEIGSGETKFIDEYKLIIDKIKELQPNAQIYIQSILPVTATKSSSNQVFSNTRINRFNELIQELTKDEQVYFLNVGESLKGTDGALIKEASSDGVHLRSEYYKVWYDYLKTHSIKTE